MENKIMSKLGTLDNPLEKILGMSIEELEEQKKIAEEVYGK